MLHYWVGGSFYSYLVGVSFCFFLLRDEQNSESERNRWLAMCCKYQITRLCDFGIIGLSCCDLQCVFLWFDHVDVGVLVIFCDRGIWWGCENIPRNLTEKLTPRILSRFNEEQTWQYYLFDSSLDHHCNLIILALHHYTSSHHFNSKKKKRILPLPPPSYSYTLWPIDDESIASHQFLETLLPPISRRTNCRAPTRPLRASWVGRFTMQCARISCGLIICRSYQLLLTLYVVCPPNFQVSQELMWWSPDAIGRKRSWRVEVRWHACPRWVGVVSANQISHGCSLVPWHWSPEACEIG